MPHGSSLRNSLPRILVVDDDENLADTLVMVLEQSGFAGTAAYDAASALNQCRASAPDVVLTDVNMPVMDGIALGVEVRRNFPGCEVILFSGRESKDKTISNERTCGFRFELLSKPVSPEKLISTIKRHLARHAAAFASGLRHAHHGHGRFA